DDVVEQPLGGRAEQVGQVARADAEADVGGVLEVLDGAHRPDLLPCPRFNPRRRRRPPRTPGRIRTGGPAAAASRTHPTGRASARSTGPGSVGGPTSTA